MINSVFTQETLSSRNEPNERSALGGLYGEYPNLDPSAQLEGDIHYNTDFRQLYSTILEDILDIDSENILNEKFSKLSLIK